MTQHESNTPVVSLQRVTKSYGNFKLGPVDLEIEPGYVVAVVGPNGSGKTTLFRLLMGLMRPDGGEIEVHGGRYPEDEVGIKRKIGYVPEAAVGHDDLNARELGSFVGHWYPTWNARRYESLLREFEIDAGQRFSKLSKGQQRRLSFAVAIACGPDLLLLDEPTDGVDPFARRTMLEEISSFLEGGDRTVLFATHVMEEIRRLADYIVFLHKGRFLGFYEKDALLEQWKVLWLDGQPKSFEIPGLADLTDGRPPRLVTRSPEETRAALKDQGVGIVRTGTLELEEILSHLMEESDSGGRNAAPAVENGPHDA